MSQKNLALPLNLNNLENIIVKGEFFLEDTTGENLLNICALKIEHEECNCARDIPWRSYVVIMRGFAFFW
jgi:hypothetical protein